MLHVEMSLVPTGQRACQRGSCADTSDYRSSRPGPEGRQLVLDLRTAPLSGSPSGGKACPRPLETRRPR